MAPTVRFRKTSIVVQLHLLVCLWVAGSLQGFCRSWLFGCLFFMVSLCVLPPDGSSGHQIAFASGVRGRFNASKSQLPMLFMVPVEAPGGPGRNVEE